MSAPAIARRAPLVRVLLACALGVATALLVSCAGGSSAKLIPVADAGPLQVDFETVASAAEAGNGSCSATEEAIAKTERDFGRLPATVDSGLRDTLRQGIENLRSRALTLCAESFTQSSASTAAKTTATHTTATTTTTTTTTTPTTSTPTNTTPSTSTPTSTTPGGGTPAPGVGEGTPGAGGGQGANPGGASGQGGGTGAGENPGEGAGDGAPGGGQEAAK